MQSTAELFLAHMQFATTETRRSTVLLMHRDRIFSTSLQGRTAIWPRNVRLPTLWPSFPSSLWGHSGQMTTEAFGRLASWSSFNIVVGRHDEFAHSRVAIPQKRGTTAKSIVLHFPPSHTLKLETPERRHSCHTRHSHYPRGRGMPRKNRQNTRSVPHPLAQIHAQCTDNTPNRPL